MVLYVSLYLFGIQYELEHFGRSLYGRTMYHLSGRTVVRQYAVRDKEGAWIKSVYSQIKVAEDVNKVSLATAVCCTARRGGRDEKPEFPPECRSAGWFMALSLRRELEINDQAILESPSSIPAFV